MVDLRCSMSSQSEQASVSVVDVGQISECLVSLLSVFHFIIVDGRRYFMSQPIATVISVCHAFIPEAALGAQVRATVSLQQPLHFEIFVTRSGCVVNPHLHASWCFLCLCDA